MPALSGYRLRGWSFRNGGHFYGILKMKAMRMICRDCEFFEYDEGSEELGTCASMDSRFRDTSVFWDMTCEYFNPREEVDEGIPWIGDN